MATKKPSLTKQISEALGTTDKREQLKFIQELKAEIGKPIAAVTVLVEGGVVSIALNSRFQLSPDNVKQILHMGVDEVTKTMVKMEEQQVVEAMGGPTEADNLPENSDEVTGEDPGPPE
jgi:hypothetical protein